MTLTDATVIMNLMNKRQSLILLNREVIGNEIKGVTPLIKEEVIDGINIKIQEIDEQLEKI